MKELFRLAPLVTLLLAGCATAGPGADALVGTPVPKMKVSKLDGRALNAHDLAGKVVLLDIWASYCDPCREELPLLDAMATRLRPKGIEIVAVSIDENRDDAAGWVKAHGSSWSLSFAHDPEGQLAQSLKVPRMPSSYIVDRAGIIRQVNAGFEREDVKKIEARLIELAGQP